MKLQENTILVTGGSSGIGLAIAKKFYNLGNKVIILGRNKDKLIKSAAVIGTQYYLVCNLTDQNQLDSLLVEIENKHPDLNILINCAGLQYNYSFLDNNSPIPRIEEEISSNFSSLVKLSSLLIPVLHNKRNAAIVNVSSGLALVPKESAPVYCATKAAVHSFTQSLRYQLEDTNIKVIELFPPVVDTLMTANRNVSKMSPQEVANRFLKGLKIDKKEIYLGRVKLLRLIIKLFPPLARRIIRHS